MITGMQVHFLREFADEGIGKALEFLRDDGGINTLFIASQHDYLASSGFDKLYHNQAREEHFVDGYFFKFDPNYYESTIVKPVNCKYTNPSGEDSFGSLVRKTKDNGFSTYAMILNRWPNSDEYPDCHMKSINGKNIPKVFCANNPNVKNLYKSIIHDLIDHYDIDGIFLALLDHYVQFGFEHLTDELAYSLGIKKFKTPEVGLTCFCDHCIALAQAKGVDVDAIRRGLMKGIKLGWIPHRVEGLSSSAETFHFLMEVPEFVTWMKFRSESFTELHQELYQFIKKLKPDCTVALNTYGPADSWKYAANFKKLAENCDWMKPMFYSGTYPGLPRTPFQIQKETQQAVQEAQGHPIIGGINGIGSVSSLKTITDNFNATVDGGARGVILSWDYALIPREHIKLFGSLVKR
jgi:hypothetical protein